MKNIAWSERSALKWVSMTVLACVVAAPGFGANWQSFRNTASNTGASTETINVPLAESWHSSDPAVEENGAVVANGVVYMASDEGLLYAFELTTGFAIAGFPVATGFSYGTPAVDAANGKVYVLTGAGLQAFNLNGTPAWTGPGSGGTNYNQGPVIDEGYVYWNGAGVLYKYDSAGVLQWSSPASVGDSQPSIMGGFVYTHSGTTIQKFDKSTGAQITTGGFPIATGSSSSAIAAADGKLFHKADILYAYDASNGTLLWSKPDGGDSFYYDSPAVSGGFVYVYGWDAQLYAFDENTGATATGFPSVALSTPGDRNWSSPSVAGDKVFVGAGTSQQLRVLGAAGSASAGIVLDSHLTFSLDLQGFDLCSPVVSDGWVLAMLDGGGLYALFGGIGPPPPGALVINNGDTCTDSQIVTLSIDNNGDASVTEMRVSEDPFFTGVAFEPYAATKSWTLSAGFGTKTVYAQLRTSGGVLSNVFTDSIDFLEACGSVCVHEICDNGIDDDCDGLIDEQDTEDCNLLYVDLGAFTATSNDGRVTLGWNTLAEIDNAGFYLLRRDVQTGTTTRLNQGLIPARGDVYSGATYGFLDSRAVNGVQFEYTLVDVDRFGNETRHPSVSAIANPINPRIKLGSPAYSTRLGLGSRTTYAWTPVPLSGATLRISPDASFPVGSTMSIGISPRQAATGLLALNPRQDFTVQALASRNGGMVYWQIVTKPVGAASDHSATFRYTYDSPGSAKIVDVKYRVKSGTSRSDR